MQDGLNPACFLFLQIEQDLRFCIIDDAFTVPNFSIIASSRTTRLLSLSVDRSLRLEVMAAEDKSLREKRKDPQH